ncbi:hypothetical protein ACFGVR_09315 [Mucilaginibacter sp. AW1-3]
MKRTIKIRSTTLFLTIVFTLGFAMVSVAQKTTAAKQGKADTAKNPMQATLTVYRITTTINDQIKLLKTELFTSTKWQVYSDTSSRRSLLERDTNVFRFKPLLTYDVDSAEIKRYNGSSDPVYLLHLDTLKIDICVLRSDKFHGCFTVKLNNKVWKLANGMGNFNNKYAEMLERYINKGDLIAIHFHKSATSVENALALVVHDKIYVFTFNNTIDGLDKVLTDIQNQIIAREKRKGDGRDY